MNDKRITAKLTYALLLLDKVENLILDIKDEIGATPTQTDLICSEIPFSINYSTEDKKSNVGQIKGSQGIKEIDYV